MKNVKIIVRGGGDLATGVIHRLWGAGLTPLVLECAHPAAIRRQVALSEAVYQGSATVEGMTAALVQSLAEVEAVMAAGKVPVLVDEDAACVAEYQPDILIDAIIAKKNLGTNMEMAPLTVALGPGFTAGVDCHAIVETKRGHNLGRIIRQGSAAPNSGVPGNIGGYSKERVLHAPCAGVLHVVRDIGSVVEKGEVIAQITTAQGAVVDVNATLTGILRGMIREGYPVTKGFKIADIDPRKEELANCFTISDKARCIAGSVLELVCAYVMGAK
ncbi:selenium-dependent molybdenum cofactor biosynthesis protein YqeB [Phascolarctobacterium sp.]|uniref:selenium-dependent molybdenum cofactor biosynthesis protein YqeB n=1 Tax=Phascolarctobacterium sp. TaxID=2049039 RepID=UPI00386415D1